MIDHLTECPAPSEYGGGEYHIYDERPCICPALRACEQRVRDDSEQWGVKAGIPCDCQFWRGYAHGLCDAANAVTAVCVDLNPDGAPSTTGNRWVTQKVAVAAIRMLEDQINV